MLKDSYPYYLANRAVAANTDLEVTDKYTGEVATRVAKADVGVLDEAIAKAAAAVGPMRALPSHRRQAVLQRCVESFEDRREELAESLCIEAGKPIKDARGEVTRLIDTFRIAAEESVRIRGEVLPLDRTARTTGYTGFWKRVPIGACSFITPWNFPLNLVAHKIGPALAVGCPFVLKPASATPLGALIIGEILAETDLPEGAFSILPMAASEAEALTTDDRLKLLSFTGSDTVGWQLKGKAGKKRVLLELGGNAGVIVDETAVLDDAVDRIITGAFYQSGQSCISVQRIFAAEPVYEKFREKLVAKAKGLKAGNPKEEDTFVGPIITEKDAKRLEDWIRSAEKAGGRVLCGGRREGNMLEATLLEDVPAEHEMCAEEAFGPVAVLSRFRDFKEALERVDDSRFGLQAGVFTRDLHRAMLAWDTLEVGGVIVGDIPSWRADAMPYGGVKDSGHGREGLRWSMEEMTEVRLMVVRDRPVG